MKRFVLLAAALLAACSKPAAAPPRPSASPAPASPQARREAACGGDAFPAPPSIRPFGRRLDSDVFGRLSAIRFEGRRRAPEATLRGALLTAVGEPLSAAKVKSDIRALFALGYFEDIDAQLEVTPSEGGRGADDRLALTFVLVERPAVGAVFFSDHGALAAGDGEASLPLHPGEPFQPEALARGLADLRGLYQKLGFRNAALRARTRAVDDDTVDVCVAADEGQQVVISSWTFSGNQKVSDAELRALMQTEGGLINAVGGVFRPDVWDNAQAAITGRYYDEGLLSVDVAPLSVVPSADKSTLAITVDIYEGPVFRVGKISFQADPAIDVKALEAVMRSRPGEVFVRKRLLSDLERIRAVLAQGGKGDLQVTPNTEVQPASSTADVSLVLAKPAAPP